jgi:hypothetical protein
VQRVLGDSHLPGQIDHEPFIRAECGPIGLRRRLIAGRPPPHDQAHDVLVEMPGALGRAESLGVEPLGDGGERPAFRAEVPDASHQPGEVAGLLVPQHRPGYGVEGPLPTRPGEAHADLIGRPFDGRLHPFDQEPDDPLPVRRYCRRGSPQRRQITGQFTDLVHVVGGERCRLCPPEAGILLLQPPIDRDFRSEVEVAALSADGIYALPVHEAENFFLHPATLRILLAQNGQGNLSPEDLIRDAADARAGSWIFQHTMATPNAKALPEIPSNAKGHAKSLTWNQIEADRNAALEGVVRFTGFESDVARKFQNILEVSAKAYGRKRTADSLWKECEGKQVLNSVAQFSGFSSVLTLMSAIFATWARADTQLPVELTAFRTYLDDL